MYRTIVDELIANDMNFIYFYKLYEDKYGVKPSKKIVNKAIKYFETGIIS